MFFEISNLELRSLSIEASLKPQDTLKLPPPQHPIPESLLVLKNVIKTQQLSALASSFPQLFTWF